MAEEEARVAEEEAHAAGEEARVAEEVAHWSCEAGELAACFTIHARDLFGYACVVSGADGALAGELVQATFEAAAAVWWTLRGLATDQCRDWLRETLAGAALSRTGHPASSALVPPPLPPLTELTIARYGPDYDAAAGLDRFAGWLRTRAARSPGAGGELPGRAGIRTSDLPTIRLARLRVLPDGGPGTTNGTGAGRPSGSYGDPVSALYEQHYASLVRLAALLVRDTATAEEIVQDAFVAVAAATAGRRRGDLDGALDFLRQSVLDRSRSALRHGITPAPPNGCPSASPPLLAALGALPARQREVLVLRYYANLSEEQAADTIGISRAAVRRHATRANATLRTLLDDG